MIGDPNSQFENWKKLSLLENTKELASSQKEIIFDCGTEDKFYGGNNLFRKKCDESQVRATYIAQPGKHDKAYWKKSIKAHFDFFKRLTENQ
jgi:S-formylglutathione hydrolase FrmB